MELQEPDFLSTSKPGIPGRYLNSAEIGPYYYNGIAAASGITVVNYLLNTSCFKNVHTNQSAHFIIPDCTVARY